MNQWLVNGEGAEVEPLRQVCMTSSLGHAMLHIEQSGGEIGDR